MRVSRHRMDRVTNLAGQRLRSQRKICRDRGNFVGIEETAEEIKECRDRMLLAATENCNKELKLYRDNTFRLRPRMQYRPEFWGFTM